jgi:hypothetical protein
MWGFLSGSLALIVLDAVLQPSASTNISGGLGKASGWLNTFLSAKSPLIRDYAAGKTTTTTASAPANNNATNVPGAGASGGTLSAQATGISAIRSYASGATSTAPGAGH